ncbi:helicase with zinc finger domain 2-like [Anneissia japonica]|uniref:helicase with zinc finger domain 2-like n=1 Tax=Anneissia japonica TaxID=1529436 RepID=UPI00142576B9|nr:helicase with zinc finger domain 2-like [Anneissia japonica]
MPSGGKSDLTTSKTPSLKTPGKKLECLYCETTFDSDIEVELHVASGEHHDKIRADSDREWFYRKPPLNVINGEYSMCERPPPCERPYCTGAHSESELKEWKVRNEYRMRQSIQKLYSEIHKIACDYHFDHSILNDSIDGVECNENGDVDRQIDVTERNNGQFTCTFEFILKCTGEKHLKCVYLLQDEHRDNFYFTQPSKEVKPQICPGNKLILDLDSYSSTPLKGAKREIVDDCMIYSVSVKFVSSCAGHFDQRIIFELRHKMYMKREISVHVGLPEDVDIPINSGSIQHNSLPWEDVIPFEEKPEFQQMLLNQAKPFKPKTTDDNLVKGQLSENNYTMMMHRFIDIEERGRQTIIRQ